jgi:hypothetical protein
MNRCALLVGVSLVACLPICGCGNSSATSQTAAANKAGASKGTKPGDDGSAKSKKREIKPIEISSSGSSSASPTDSAERVESARVALKPLQILIGDWNGTSRNAVLDEPNWAWDLKTDPKQPSLRITSEKGKYVRDGRLTFLPASQEFEFQVKDGEGVERLYRGKFSQEVQDVPGDDKKLQRTYKLELIEPQPNADGEQWRIVINQQENNRYILEVDRKRGSVFNRMDTINTQREGTSFAVSDTDYGDKTCVISQGLGTISVSYKGKSYWVCCTGCKAAFEDDPEKWITKFEAMNKDKMKK